MLLRRLTLDFSLTISIELIGNHQNLSLLLLP